jgi:tRNA dimethylallyltransferase
MNKNPEEYKKPMVVLTGPTAVGKTALSIELAKKINGAIISADSMQVYKYMDIGSAKIMPEEMQGIRHYLVDELDPGEEFHIVRFQEMAKQALEEIYANGQIPIIVGGTGFYIQALLYDIDFTEQNADASFREEMQQYADHIGAEALHEKLKEIDPVSYETIHANNVKRVIRALEYYHQTGQPISEHNEQEHHKKSPFNFAYFVLNDDRAKLYERIEQRIDIMLDQGLIEEVQSLKSMGCSRGMVSMQGLGYKEILDYLDGRCTLEEAVYILKRDTRHFAKRQITWFKRERDVIWLNKPDYAYDETRILDEMISVLTDKKIFP